MFMTVRLVMSTLYEKQFKVKTNEAFHCPHGRIAEFKGGEAYVFIIMKYMYTVDQIY